MNIFELISLLEEELENSPNVAFSGNKKRVDLERIDEIISEMRQTLPDEIRQAELIRKEKQAILDDARVQSEAMIREAERRSRELVEEHEITKIATQKGEEYIANAQKNAREIRLGARGYAEDVLDDLEKYMGEYIEAIRRNRESLTTNNSGKENRNSE